MLFSSTIFLFAFLPAVLTLYFVLPSLRLRNTFLLAASLLFYAWGELGYVVVLLASIAANYGFGLWISARSAEPGRARTALLVAVASNLLLLGVFKYANFIAATLAPAAQALGLPAPTLEPVHLPIGISFFTFQALTYVVDVYRGDARAQRNPLISALYISLFPQLIAGPIVRYREIAAELTDRTSCWADVAAGAQRFTFGLGKKVLIANALALPADRIFALPIAELPAPVAWLGVVCFGLQIYFDFSGYSDMAIGLGRMLGFHFPENFLYPYTSRSVREFWRRWHITLSTWFRDYVYIPLGGNRGSATRTGWNLVLVFFLCGLWHGASWNFIAWGLLHGVFLVLERGALGRLLERLPSLVGTVYTLLAVTLGWVFFRADDLPHAVGYLGAMFSPSGAQGSPHVLAVFLDARVAVALVLAAVGCTPWLRARGERTRDSRARFDAPGLGFVTMIAVLVASAMALVSGTHNPFIYFRF
jgi:alginate O-acetyltransferase complex protein AlgI